MVTLLSIIIFIACAILAFFILVQNPKGGGLSGTFGSMGTQVMGVKKSSDVMEKGTWISIGVIALLCVAMVAFYPKNDLIAPAPAQQQQQQPAPAQQQAPTEQSAPAQQEAAPIAPAE